MGFWSSFFGAGAAHVYNEMKKEEKEAQKWNDNLLMTSNYEEEFSNYLKSIGSSAIYVSGLDESASSVKNTIDRYKRKIKEYLNLGGEGRYIYDVEEIDEYIEVMKYLKSVDCVNRQQEFLGLDLFLIKSQLERELREDKGIQILLKAPGNELMNPISQNDFGFVLYDEDSENAIKIDVAQVYDEDIIEFLQFKTIALKFTQQNIYVYSYDDHAQIYYKATVSDTKQIEIVVTPIPAVSGWGLVQIDGLETLFSLEEAEKVRKFYLQHNEKVINLNEKVKQSINSEENMQMENQVSNSEELVIDGVKFWSSTNEEFMELEMRVVFEPNRISMSAVKYNKEIFSQDIPEGANINIEIIDTDSPIQSVLKFANAIFLMRSEDAERVEQYYKSHSERLEEDGEFKQNEIKRISNEIENLDNMVMNMLNLVDEHILLNHDTVICLQLLLAYNKFPNIKLWDENSLNNENILLGMAVIKQSLDDMVELIRENCLDYTDEEIRFACWEAVKRVSVRFYSNIWEEKYGRYIDKPLKQSVSAEADGSLDRYIEDIIKCNEIDDTDVWTIGIFTYYFMNKGYTSGELYFPPYYEMAVQAFDVIRENMRKNEFKEKLKGTVKKQETHYSIDDVDMMNGNEFEHFVCELYSKMGYKAEVTKQSGDQGLDVIAEKGNKRVGIQAKCYSGTVGNSAIQEAVAGKSYYHCDKVVVVTNSYFTQSAKELAQSNEVILWDRDILKEKIERIM